MDLHKRFKHMMNLEGLSGNQFDAKCSFSRGYMNNLLRTKGDIGHSRLMKILEIFDNYSRQWVIFGTGEIFNVPTDNNVLLHNIQNIEKKYPAYCLADPDGKVEFINDKYTEQTGWALKEIKGKKPGDYLRYSDFPEKVLEQIRQNLKLKHITYHEIYPNYHKLGFPMVCELLVLPVVYKKKIKRFISFANFRKMAHP